VSKTIQVKIHKKAIILPVVLYGCETWSPPFEEEHRLRSFESRVLRRLLVLKRN
jgi:hypothetical protein